MANPSDIRMLSEQLRAALEGKGTDFTISDAAALSGHPLRYAELALHELIRVYPGHLRVSDEGTLIFRFPEGFVRRNETPSWFQRGALALSRVTMALLRFVLRAWISVVLVLYVGLFLALLLGVFFLRVSRSDEGKTRLGFGFVDVLVRLVFEAFYWTFHPLSYTGGRGFLGGSSRWRRDEDEDRDLESKKPFYEQVNGFVFGPEQQAPSEKILLRRLLHEIREKKGRVGLSDVLRVTELPRSKADALMSSLLVDYDGTVEVSENGAIYYAFRELRKSVNEGEPSELDTDGNGPQGEQALTGNTAEQNLLIGGLNGFNLVAALWAISNHYTIENLKLLFAGERILPLVGTPVLLGIIPLIFSSAIFLFPLVRSLLLSSKRRERLAENGRRALVRTIVMMAKRGAVTEQTLRAVWEQQTGSSIGSKELNALLVEMGADVDFEGGEKIRYRFPELEAEAVALEQVRRDATDAEATVGPIVFSSE